MDPMNDPNMMNMMQKLMSDPELLQLMQNPDTMTKLQEVMQNPASIMKYRNDRDIMSIFEKIQGMSGGAGGMGGGLGGLGSGAFGRGNRSMIDRNPQSSRNQNDQDYNKMNSNDDLNDPNLIHIKNKAHLEQILKESGKPVIVDFFANWCRPCNRVAPVFARLASEFANRIIFLKVDVEKHKDIQSEKQIFHMPTFQIYKDNVLIKEFKGANPEILTQEVTEISINTYCYFPLNENSIIFYKDAKYDLILKNIFSFNDLYNDKVDDDQARLLTDSDKKDLQDLISILKNIDEYHTSNISPLHFKIIDKLLTWKIQHLPPVLQLIRLLPLHPSAASYYAIRLESNDSNMSPITTLYDLIRKQRDQTTAEKIKINIILFLRFVCNLFFNPSSRYHILLKYDTLASFLMNIYNDEIEIEIRITIINIMINYTIFAVKFHSQRAEFFDIMINVLTTMFEILRNEVKESNFNQKIIQRVLSILGTLSLASSECKSTLNGMELTVLIKVVQKKIGEEKSIKNQGTDYIINEICIELLRILQT